MTFDSLKPIVDWLSYRSYEANRLRNPWISPERWKAIYPDSESFEEIFNNYMNTKKGKNHVSCAQ